MTDDYDFEIRRKPGAFEPPPTLFICILCEKEVNEQDWRLPVYGRPREREPLCKSCTSNWGTKVGGPVFNRNNFHALRQVSAMITRLEWEIHNGHRGYR